MKIWQPFRFLFPNWQCSMSRFSAADGFKMEKWLQSGYDWPNNRTPKEHEKSFNLRHVGGHKGDMATSSNRATLHVLFLSNRWTKIGQSGKTATVCVIMKIQPSI